MGIYVQCSDLQLPAHPDTPGLLWTLSQVVICIVCLHVLHEINMRGAYRWCAASSTEKRPTARAQPCHPVWESWWHLCDTCAPRAQTRAGRRGTLQQPAAPTASFPAGQGCQVPFLYVLEINGLSHTLNMVTRTLCMKNEFSLRT